MQASKLFRVAPVAAAIGIAAGFVIAAAPVAGATGAHSTMTATETGKIAKFTSSSAFTITVAKKTYVVKTNDMTHVTIDMRKSKVSALKTGQTVTVKGSVEMETITAATITEQM